ncbi:MAG: multicomponent Na+H+ antiporter subunit [Actinobacteria bacterium]|nr:MAG: multicomponent Na+H+ antiporter subunit [Actinomycetota bacterium]
MDSFFWGLGIFLFVNAFLCLLRAYWGPSVADRILAVNIVGTKTLLVLVLLGYIFGRPLYLDIALVYGLLNFAITVITARFIETGRLTGDWT